MAVHMDTVRKRVGPLPIHRLDVIHSVDYSSSDHFSLDDSLRDSSSSSSTIPSSGMRPSHHLCSLVSSIPRSSAAISDRPSHDSSSASPSRKWSRSPAASVPLSSPIPRALSYARADLLPSPKRIRSPELAMDLEVSSAEGSDPSRYKGTELEMDNDSERSDGIDIDPEIQEIETGTRGPVEVRVDRVTHLVIVDDIREPAQEERAIEVAYETLGDLVQRFHDHTEEILVHRVQAIESLERDNRRLRDMIDVASQRVTQSQRRELRVQREMRQIRRFRFYDRMRIARLEAYTRRHLVIVIMTMPNTRSGASRTREGINDQINRRLAGALGARDAAQNLEPLISGGSE
ncbi:hypothetical protein Tco_0651628 [Tanacetum coccineum]|uniref:Uncharacterized protein n=1 Tax=Tanacetum coccineum TaxID=301880 RepID=A0ABQ4WVB0_9ASTR